MPIKSATPYGGNCGVTSAQTAPATAGGAVTSERLVRDPVCGMEISPSGATASAEVDQKRYWFCSPHCEQAFLADPARYTRRPAPQGPAGHSSSARPPADAPVPAPATPASASSGAKQLAKDPICGMMVDKATALSTERGNRKYYFCSESCLRTFES
ncbi:YHS domain-containing protein, partial [Cupriavidus necator]